MTLRKKGSLDVEINATEIRDIFAVVVTLEHLGPITTCTGALRDLGTAMIENTFPLIIDLHSLEDMLRLLDTPWSLFHYLHRRSSTLKHVDLWAPEELDIVMFYLKSNLFFDCYPAGSTIKLGIETDELDEWAYVRRGHRSSKARKPSQHIPPQLERLLVALATTRPAGWTVAVDQLLDMNNDGRKELSRGFKRARQLVRTQHDLHDVSIDSSTDLTERSGVSIVVGPPNDDDIEERCHFLTHLNGLRMAPNRWVGIACQSGDGALTPTSVIVATPPFDQVVDPAEAKLPPQWNG